MLMSGFKSIGSALHAKLKIHDSCGVNNLHGIPGFMAGLLSVLGTDKIQIQSQFVYSQLHTVIPYTVNLVIVGSYKTGYVQSGSMYLSSIKMSKTLKSKCKSFINVLS